MNKDTTWCSAAYRKVDVPYGMTWIICPECDQPTPISITHTIRPHPVYAKVVVLHELDSSDL